MNYRHIYHAGNICDVVKHAVLTLLIAHLKEKEKGFYLLDTHAGIGLYDLQDERAEKTAEAKDGICKFLASPEIPELADYYAILKKLNPQAFRYYPGSPLLAQYLLRAQDRLAACELHPEDFKTLKQTVPKAQAHNRDGYEALQAFLPPPEKRGFVLIDPPYEQPDEFAKLPGLLKAASLRWPQGQYALWYPIKDRPILWKFHEEMAATGISKMLCAEFIYEEEARADRLNGCGFIFINPPWQFDTRLQNLLPKIHAALDTQYHGVTMKWLTAE